MIVNENPITLRTATAADAPALVELALRCSIDTFARYHSAENFRKYLDATHSLPSFERELAEAAALVLIAENAARQPIAYARLRWGSAPDCVGDANALEIEKFYVDRPYHGKGVATAMMNRCLDFARERSHDTIFLGVWERNDRAIAFYTRKWGYQRCGEHLFMVGDDVTTDWWLRRAVGLADSNRS